MAPYLMNFRKYLINSWWGFFYRQHYTFDVKTCFQQNRYVFDVIVTSWTSCIYYMSMNFADISTLLKKLITSAVMHQKYYSRLLELIKHKYCLVHDCGGVKFLKKTTGKCSNITGASMTFRGLRSTIFPIFAVKTIVCRHITN